MWLPAVERLGRGRGLGPAGLPSAQFHEPHSVLATRSRSQRPPPPTTHAVLLPCSCALLEHFRTSGWVPGAFCVQVHDGGRGGVSNVRSVIATAEGSKACTRPHTSLPGAAGSIAATSRRTHCGVSVPTTQPNHPRTPSPHPKHIEGLLTEQHQGCRCALGAPLEHCG